jgi:hypothetical protein
MTSPPSDGFTVPVRYPTASRVRSDFPTAPHPNVGRWVSALVVLVLVGSAMAVSLPDRLRPAGLTVVGVLALGFAGPTVLALVSGPTLAVSPAGIWVLVRPGRAVYLPWLSAGRVAVCRRLRGGNYLVSVLPPVLPDGLGGLTGLVQRWRRMNHPRHVSALMVVTGALPDVVVEMMAHYPLVHANQGRPWTPPAEDVYLAMIKCSGAP